MPRQPLPTISLSAFAVKRNITPATPNNFTVGLWVKLEKGQFLIQSQLPLRLQLAVILKHTTNAKFYYESCADCDISIITFWQGVQYCVRARRQGSRVKQSMLWRARLLQQSRSCVGRSGPLLDADVIFCRWATFMNEFEPYAMQTPPQMRRTLISKVYQSRTWII